MDKMLSDMLERSKLHVYITCGLSVFTLILIITVNMQFTTDMHSMTKEHSFISDLGLILWCVAATVCLFAAILLHNNQLKQVTRFLLFSALLSAYLLFDDFMQIHELYLPKYLYKGEQILYFILIIAVFVYLLVYKQIILQTNYIILMMALVYFSLSIAADGMLAPLELIYGGLVVVAALNFYLFAINRQLFLTYFMVFVIIIGLCVAFISIDSKVIGPEYLFEKSAKWMGISSWCSYYVHTAYQIISNTKVNVKVNLPVT